MINTLILLVALLIFAFLAGTNWATVKLSYVFGIIELPLAVVIVSSVLVGALIATFVNLANRAKASGRIKQLGKRLDSAKQEIALLKSELEKHESLASAAAEMQYDETESEDRST